MAIAESEQDAVYDRIAKAMKDVTIEEGAEAEVALPDPDTDGPKDRPPLTSVPENRLNATEDRPHPQKRLGGSAKPKSDHVVAE